MEIRVFRAADAFLYLPTYIADKKGIFVNLIKDCKVIFETPGRPKSGDTIALEAMLEENANDSNDNIAFAICDPSTCVSSRFNHKLKNECVVVGALIDRLPFWAVNHYIDELVSIEDFKNHFKEVIFYKPQLVTGNYLGNFVCNTAQLSSHDCVDFGDEILTLTQKYNPSYAKKYVAITADIVSMVKQLRNTSDPININYRFSKNNRFIATGIVTTRKVCENEPEKVVNFLQGIQKAIFILNSSREIALEVCKEIAADDAFYTEPQRKNKLNDEDITWIIDNIFKQENFYPANLSIEKSDWVTVLAARDKTEQWLDGYRDQLYNSFEKHVDNSFLLQSKKEIAKDFGININTFKEELGKAILESEKNRKNVFKLLQASFKAIGRHINRNNKRYLWCVLGFIVCVTISIVNVFPGWFWVKFPRLVKFFKDYIVTLIIVPIMVGLLVTLISYLMKNDKK